MANLFAGVGTSHVPGIGAAVDHEKTQLPYWKTLFDGMGQRENGWSGNSLMW